ncbi:hypothetical protein ZOSMA_1G01380 [Zostera marina]|uniref:CENP-C n=1 Tax=Zostera marina TaxID=29655 RepID=A0A0K9PPL6_ZOSMR|nr:hypothetical protein ZOSMA_1G01380 [Zostera marina]
MNTTVVPAGHQGDELPPQIFIQNQPSQSPLHCEATNTIEEVLQSLDAVDDDIQTNVGDTDRLKDRLGEVLHEENEQTESVRGQSSASMDTSVLPARHQESFSISAEQHIEIETRVPKQRGRPKLGTRNSKQKSLAGGTAFVSGVRRSTRMKFKPLEHWRGEKLLFGCVDEGLPTLLGVKCSTPDGGKKVKLCVSDEQYTRFLPNAAFY